MVIEMNALKANLAEVNTTPASTSLTTQPTQIPAPPLQPTTSTTAAEPAIDDVQNSDVSFEYNPGLSYKKKFEADFEDPENI